MWRDNIFYPFLDREKIHLAQFDWTGDLLVSVDIIGDSDYHVRIACNTMRFI